MKFLRSFLPWIAVAVLGNAIGVRYALLTGLVIAVGLLAIQRRDGRGWDAQVIECSAALFFAVATVIAFIAPHSALVTNYSSPASSLWLAITAWGSLVVGHPFTLGIAKLSVPRERWTSPVFLRVNRLITLVWAASFTVSGVGSILLRLFAPHDGTALTLLSIAGFVVPMAFTVRYPKIVRARSAAPHAETSTM